NRTGATREARDALASPIATAVEEATAAIVAAAGATRHTEKTHEDQILVELIGATRGRVGSKPTEAALAADTSEGLRRSVAGIAPGFRDAQKGDDRKTGDYLVWIDA